MAINVPLSEDSRAVVEARAAALRPHVLDLSVGLLSAVLAELLAREFTAWPPYKRDELLADHVGMVYEAMRRERARLDGKAQ